MATKENEYYLRAILLLAEGGSYISKKVLYRELSGDFNKLLKTFERELKHELHEKQIEKLFPRTGNTVVDTWDLQTLIIVVLRLFRNSLTREDIRKLRDLKSLRNEVQAHSPSVTLDAVQYGDIKGQLTDALTSLASGFGENEQKECRSIINKYTSGPLDVMSARECLKQLQNNDVLFKQVLEKIETSKNDICMRFNATSDDVKYISQQVTVESAKDAGFGTSKVTDESAVDFDDEITKMSDFIEDDSTDEDECESCCEFERSPTTLTRLPPLPPRRVLAPPLPPRRVLGCKSISSAALYSRNVGSSSAPPSRTVRPPPPPPRSAHHKPDPLSGEDWYHGEIERSHTNSRLMSIGQDGTFLVRKSIHGGDAQPYTLAVLYEGHVYNLKLRKRSDGKVALGKEKPDELAFKDVPTLIQHKRNQSVILWNRKENKRHKILLKKYPININRK